MLISRCRSFSHVCSMLLALLVMAMVVTAASAADATIALAKDGKALAVIVVQKEAEPPAADATEAVLKARWHYQAIEKPAQDLKHYLDRITGATFPLIVEGDALPAGVDMQIHVGQTKAALAAKLDFPSGFDDTIRPELFEEEGYVIKVKGKTLYLVGNQSGPYRGTSYAVYDFLNQVGVRWYLPGEWGESVPTNRNLMIPAFDLREQPDFAVRHINQGGWITATAQEAEEYHWFIVRNRMNPGGTNGHPASLYPITGDGFLAMWMPNMFAEHPEYYAMSEKGERAGGSDRFSMLCLSNPELFGVYVDTVKKLFEANNNHWLAPIGIGISPPDGAPYCYCLECLKESFNFDYPQYTHTPMISEPYFEFGAKLAKEFPDKIVGLMAYSSREMPPQGVKFQPNNSLMYAPISTDSLHPFNHPTAWRTQETYKILKQYVKQTPHVTVYDYNPGLLLTNYVPERETENIAVNARLMRELGVKGVASEGRKSHMATWLSHYATARFLWDADEDLDALKADFYNTFFGPAGEPVRAWWDACADLLVSRKIQAHEDWFLTKAYDLEFVESIEPYVAQAQKAATAEPYKSRVEAFAQIAKNLRGYAVMWDGEKQVDYQRALEGAQMMEDAKAALHGMSGHFNNPTTSSRIPFMCTGNLVRLRGLIALTDGTKGKRLADIPMMAKFAKDPFNEGVVDEWYLTEFDDSQWSQRDTFHFIEQAEDEYLDEVGHDFDGHAWYRMKVNVAKPGQNTRLRLSGAANEAWVWVNGEFVGHRKHLIWWMSPHTVDLDISKAVKPGENIITVRTHNNSEVGGLYHRGFIYEAVAE